MKIYFTLKSIPQFNDLTKSEIGRQYRFYYPRLLSHWLIWITISINVFLYAAFEIYIRGLLGQVNPASILVRYAMLFRVGYVIIAVFFYRIIVYGIIASYASKDADKSTK